MKTYTLNRLNAAVPSYGSDPEGCRKAEESKYVPAHVAEGLAEALKAIAEHDALFEENPGAFGAHAFRRVQFTALTALAAAEEA